MDILVSGGMSGEKTLREEQRKKQLEVLKNIKDKFENAHYPQIGKHMSLDQAIKTIAGDKSIIYYKDRPLVIELGGKEFKLLSAFCPDFKDSRTFPENEDICIKLSRDEYCIDFYIGIDGKIKEARMFKLMNSGSNKITEDSYVMVNSVFSDNYTLIDSGNDSTNSSHPRQRVFKRNPNIPIIDTCFELMQICRVKEDRTDS